MVNKNVNKTGDLLKSLLKGFTESGLLKSLFITLVNVVLVLCFYQHIIH